VMRDILADAATGGSGISGLGTRLEVSRRLRTDQKFRADWSSTPRKLTERSSAASPANGRPAWCAVTCPFRVLTRYLELSFEGLVSHLAMGLPADDLRAVLDVVESSVRRPAPRAGLGPARLSFSAAGRTIRSA